MRGQREQCATAISRMWTLLTTQMSEHVAAQRTPFAGNLRWRRGQRVASLLIFAALAFSGCVRFSPRPLSPTETAANFSARTLAEPALQQFIQKNLNVRFESWPFNRGIFRSSRSQRGIFIRNSIRPSHTGTSPTPRF